MALAIIAVLAIERCLPLIDAGTSIGRNCLWRPLHNFGGPVDRDEMQGAFLQPIVPLLARKATLQTARVRLITDRREFYKRSLKHRPEISFKN